MKRIITLAAVLMLAASAQASSFWDNVQTFFDNAPTNKVDIGLYGVKDVTLGKTPQLYGLGAGLSLSYWITPVVGAALRVDYCDSSWTATSLALSGRGAVNIGTFAKFTPYVFVGPAWNIKGPSQEFVVDAGGGGEVSFTKWPKWAFFGEFHHLTTTEPIDRIEAGIHYRF